MVIHEKNLMRISHLPANALKEVLMQAQVVISRSGYSSLMDYAALGLSQVILVPTPGQTEQVYLARRMQEQGIALYQNQSSFALPKALMQVKTYKGFPRQKSPDLLMPVLQRFLRMVH